MRLKILGEVKRQKKRLIFNKQSGAGDGRKRRKTTNIYPRAVIALAASRVWFMREKKWACLSAVTCGPCDLLWWLERSHHIHSGCQDKERWDSTLILIIRKLWCWSVFFTSVQWHFLVDQVFHCVLWHCNVTLCCLAQSPRCIYHSYLILLTVILLMYGEAL